MKSATKHATVVIWDKLEMIRILKIMIGHNSKGNYEIGKIIE